jgi:hypothetical protein
LELEQAQGPLSAAIHLALGASWMVAFCSCSMSLEADPMLVSDCVRRTSINTG